MLTHSEIILLWPTIAEFARDIGVEYQAARQMRNRDSIHSHHWEAVVDAAKKNGFEQVTYEALAKNIRKKKLLNSNEHTAA